MRRPVSPLVLVALLAFTPLSGFADNVAPPKDDDLAALAAAAGKAAEASRACDPKACPQFDCDAAGALCAGLDDARASLYDMLARLKEAAEDNLSHMQELQYSRDMTLLDQQRHDEALALSKALSQSGKVLLDLASIVDAAKTLSDLKEIYGGENLGYLSQADQWALAAKTTDQMIELANNGIGAVDDAMALKTGSGFVPKETADLQIYKGMFSDVLGACLDFREKYKLWSEITVEGAGPRTLARHAMSLPERTAAMKGLKASAKSLGQLAGKLLGVWADKEQEKLQKRIDEDIESLKGLDAALASAHRDDMRLVQRRLAAQRALDALRAAYEKAYRCGAACPGVLGPSPPKTTFGETYGRALRTGATYGEALRDYNARLGPMAARIEGAAARFSVTPGKEPSLAATPRTVPPGGAVSAQYLIGDCPATEGARLQLMGESGAPEDLGEAKRGEKGTAKATAPKDPGEYTLRIVDSHMATLISDTFRVARESCSLAGTWAATYKGAALRVRIAQSGDRVVATLETPWGVYLPAGTEAFSGSYAAKAFSAQQSCAYPNYDSPFKVAALITMADCAHFTEALADPASCSDGGFPISWSKESP